MNHVAENINLTVAPMSKVDDAPADKQVLIRATEYDRTRWKDASVKSAVLLNPRNAETPETGVGWVPEETGWAITYPRSSFGPFQNCGLAENP
jgi:hypothetical protein